MRERTGVSRKLPDLLVRQKASEGRHPVRTPLANCGGDVLDRIAVNPDVIHERRAHAAASVEVAADAVHGAEQLLAGSDLLGIIHDAPAFGAFLGDGLISARREWHEGNLRFGAARIACFRFRTLCLFRVAS